MKNKTLRDIIWDKTGLSWWCDWFQLNPRTYVWININLIHFYVEYDKIGNEFVLELALLGFNLRWQHSMDKYLETPENNELKKRVKEVEKNWKLKKNEK